MYVFTCSNNHKSYSASKEQRDSSCPTCGEPTHLVTNESQDKPTKAVPND